MADAQYYGPPDSGQAVQSGSVGEAYAQASASNPNADVGNTHSQDASGRGAVIGGDASAKTSMGGGGSSGGGGGGGGGSGGGGYSLGASLADSGTFGLGFSGDVNGKAGFGDFNTNFGGTQSNGLSGKVLAIAGAGVAVIVVILALVFRRKG